MNKLFKLTFTTIVLMLLTSCDTKISDMLEIMERSNIICVDQSASGNGSGENWKNACTTIEDAVLVAKDGDEIWIAGDIDNISSTMTINKKVVIIGGFDNDDQVKSDRLVNSRSKVSGIGGLFGLLYIQNTEATIENLDLKNTSNDGRVISIESNAKVKINNCSFNDNELITVGDNGGAISITTGSNVQITNSVFSICVSSNYAGAIYVSDSVLNLFDCNFSKCDSSGGGAIYIEDGAELTMLDCKLTTNDAGSGNGGAVYVSTNCMLKVDNCIFQSNSVGALGGAIYVEGSTAEIIDSSFTSNEAISDSTSHGGGAIAIGASLDVLLKGCNFNLNKVYGASDYNMGGAVISDDSILNIDNCDFYSNEVYGGATRNDGGAIYGNSGTIFIYNGCVFSGNSAVTGGNSINFLNSVIYNSDNIFTVNTLDPADCNF